MKLKSRLRDLLDVEFAGEREVAGLAATDGAPKEGAWRAATHIGHFHHWRRAFGRHLAAVLTGLPAVAPPEDVDAENERQLALDREASPESLVRAWKASWAEMLGLLRNCSEPDLLRGPGWYGSQSVGIAMLRNSYTHPRAHLIDFHFERGRHERAAQLADEIADVAHEFQLLDPRFPAGVLVFRGTALALRGRPEPAVEAFRQAVALRPVLGPMLRDEGTLASLRERPDFEELTAATPPG